MNYKFIQEGRLKIQLTVNEMVGLPPQEIYKQVGFLHKRNLIRRTAIIEKLEFINKQK